MYRVLIFVILLASSLTAVADCSVYMCRDVRIETIHKNTNVGFSVATSGNENKLACRQNYNQLTTKQSKHELMIGDFLNLAKEYGLPADIYLYDNTRAKSEGACVIKGVVVKEIRKDVKLDGGGYYQKSIPRGMDFSILLLPQAYIERQKLSKAKDERIKLRLSLDGKDKLTLKMRQWFETVKIHLNAIERESLESVSMLSALSGKMMKKQNSLPSGVKELSTYNLLNQASHEAFSDLAEHARKEELEAFRESNNKLMQLCVECHSSYRFE